MWQHSNKGLEFEIEEPAQDEMYDDSDEIVLPSSVTRRKEIEHLKGGKLEDAKK